MKNDDYAYFEYTDYIDIIQCRNPISCCYQAR